MHYARLGERAEQKVQVMSSGSLALDIALGAGGYLKSYYQKFTDQNHQLKQLQPSMLLLRHKKKRNCCLLSTCASPAYAAALGVNIDELLLSQPDSR